MASHVVFTMEVTRSGPKRNLHCWSELPLDLMWLVFDRLGFADFERARTDKNYGLLFNPEEKDKFYDTQDLVNDFGKSSCVATYKSWLLMITYTEEVYLYNPYIFDLLTRERINLLSFESDYGFISPVLWIDEKTKDYLVVRMFNEENAVSIRKGDNSWKPITQLQFPCIYECYNMVYKDHKLYCLDHYNLTIFDFSGHVPSQVFEISVDGCVNRTTVAGAIRHLGTIPCKHYLACYKNSMVVTVDGDVLILNSVRESMSYIWDFKIYKMGSLTGSKWEEIFSFEPGAQQPNVLRLSQPVLAIHEEIQPGGWLIKHWSASPSILLPEVSSKLIHILSQPRLITIWTPHTNNLSMVRNIHTVYALNSMGKVLVFVLI
uniref:KIB1-4 beta-propeller domain-containing protein n=1 Tax=Brassica campestris TaxID=3711 RepID=M4DSA4_BRACM